jgi:CRP-like cAMP-binding protein
MMVDVELLIANGGVFKKLQKGEIIFKEGAACSFYYQLVSGKVKWENIDDEGKEFIQVFVETGECFGELPLFDGEPYAATAIAYEDAVIIRLHKNTFCQLLKENPEIHAAFTKLLALRVRYKFELLRAFASQNPELRISTLLNHFKKENKNICGKCRQVMLTRQQIADMTGLRVETVIRSMRKMHDKGSLLIDKGKVYC